MRLAAFVFVIAINVAPAAPLAAAPFTATDLMMLKRIADPRVSPDGRSVVYTATEIDLTARARNSDLWLVPVTGGDARRLTTHPKSDSAARWSPDGTRIAFVSARDGEAQAYVMDPFATAEPRRVTGLSTGVSAAEWVDNRTLLVVSDVYPGCADDACNRKRLEETGKPSSARVYDRLMVRHWDTWRDGRVSHLFVVSTDGGDPRDLTPGDRAVPPFNLGGPSDLAVSPDGLEVCFARKDAETEATSTNADLFVVPTAGGISRQIAASAGYDGAPQYSSDGSRIAFRAQMRGGYESDRWRLMVYERKSGITRNLTEAFDAHVEGFAWARDGKSLYFTASEAGREPIFTVPAAGGPVKLVLEGTFSDLQAIAGGRVLVATQASLTYPSEVVRVNTDGTGLARVTTVNDPFLAGFRLRAAESVTYAGAETKPVQAWIVRPADFDPAKKYPLLVLIHGGPQGAWSDGWTYRWNAQVFANAGYVVFMPNPRGSIGWGQEFVDDINKDWGGRAFDDILRGTDSAESLPYVAKGRTVAAGASYGGYMVNWIAGHSDRYRALVSHDGVFDLASMYGSTEELWFPDWEFAGPYWENPSMYERWSPSRFVRNFKTPTLVIHGELDYRVPLEQGLGMFTALQRKGVPSKLVIFPDENHWVLKPWNSVRWYQEVLAWLDQWAKR